MAIDDGITLEDVAGTEYFSVDGDGNVSCAGTLTPTGAIAASAGIASTGRITTTDGVTSGTARVVGGRAYTNTAASAAITNTTTETLFDAQYSIPADTLKAGTRVRIKYQGIATATNSTDTLAVKCYIGGLSGTALITHAATDVDDNDIFCGEVELIVRTIGTGGTFVATTKYNALAQAATAVLQGFVASTAIDTTAAQVIGVSAEWSVASTANSCRLDILSVDIA